MNFEALDGTKLLLLMLAGVAFAAAGLYLMIRPKAGDAAKIEIFGLKFESSSAGLLVFIVGAAFMAIPLFAPEKSSSSNVAGVMVGAGNGHAETGGAQDDGTRRALLLPSGPQANEIEPNDRVQQALQLDIGATVSGKSRRGDNDWYVIPTAGLDNKKLIVGLRYVSGPDVYGEVFDSREKRTHQIGWVGSGAQTREADLFGQDRIYVRVATYDYDEDNAVYEVFTTLIDP